EAQVDRPAEVAALVVEATAAVDAVLEEPLTPDRLGGALAGAVDSAWYWQEPDGVDRALAVTVDALAPLAARVVASEPAWWAAPCSPQDQWLVEWEGVDAWYAAPPDALVRWRKDTLDDEVRAAQRPSDVRANWSGHWWSTPCLAGLPSTIRPGPAGPALVEDSLGWETATCHPVVPVRPPRIREMTCAADWVALVRAHPLDVTRSRRHDWWRTTGVDGRWLIPDWAAVARDHDAVHLTARAYLEAAGVALPVGGGTYTVLAGWDPDRTWWLTDLLRPAGVGEPRRWVRTDEGWRPG
ncbi:hypothetical protein, partial [Pseudonocardia abyssalis]